MGTRSNRRCFRIRSGQNKCHGAYPGAGPEEIEQGIILVLEEAVQGLEGIDETSASAAREGSGTVILESPDRR